MSRTVDVQAVEVADSLLAELAGNGPHPAGDTPDARATHHGDGHSIPPIHTPSETDPTPSFSEDPPVDGTKVATLPDNTLD